MYTLALRRGATSYTASFADNRRPRARNARRWCRPCRDLVIPPLLPNDLHPFELLIATPKFQQPSTNTESNPYTVPSRSAFSRFSLIERSAEDLTSPLGTPCLPSSLRDPGPQLRVPSQVAHDPRSYSFFCWRTNQRHGVTRSYSAKNYFAPRQRRKPGLLNWLYTVFVWGPERVLNTCRERLRAL